MTSRCRCCKNKGPSVDLNTRFVFIFASNNSAFKVGQIFNTEYVCTCQAPHFFHIFFFPAETASVYPRSERFRALPEPSPVQQVACVLHVTKCSKYVSTGTVCIGTLRLTLLQVWRLLTSHQERKLGHLTAAGNKTLKVEKICSLEESYIGIYDCIVLYSRYAIR